MHGWDTFAKAWGWKGGWFFGYLWEVFGDPHQGRPLNIWSPSAIADGGLFFGVSFFVSLFSGQPAHL